MLCAPLTRPATVGWSGIFARKISRWFLNMAVSPWLLFLSEAGRVLNRATPLTDREPSLAFLREAGVLGTLAGTAFLPVLLSVEVKVMS